MAPENDVKLVKTICNMCLNRCGINVYVKDGKIIGVAPMQEHPLNNLCVKENVRRMMTELQMNQ